MQETILPQNPTAGENNKEAEKKFRLSAKNLFLTYPNCNIGLDFVLIELKRLLSNSIIKDYLIVKEFSNDPGKNPILNKTHIHVYVKTTKVFNTYNCHYLDISDRLGNKYHGNYQVAKKPNLTLEYLLKDIKSKEDPNMIYSESLATRIDSFGNFLDFGQTILKLAEDGKISEALELYKKEKSLDFIKNKSRIEKSLREIFLSSQGFKTKFNYSNFIVPEGLKDILDNYNKGKTLVLIGPPGTGKTQFVITWLKEILNLEPLVINNLDSLRMFDPVKHGAIVFDDVKWATDLPREDLIKYLDSEVPTTHSIKHSSVSVPYPTPRVAISNTTKPFVSPLGSNYHDAAVKRRIIIYVMSSIQTFIPSSGPVRSKPFTRYSLTKYDEENMAKGLTFCDVVGDPISSAS